MGSLGAKWEDLVHMFPDHFQSLKFVEGEDFSAGSVIQWNYDLEIPPAAKIKIQVVDDVNKYLVYESVEGDLLNYYKVFRAKLEVIDGGLNKVGGNFAKWIIEFERANENMPSPENYLELAIKVSKGLDAFILSKH